MPSTSLTMAMSSGGKTSRVKMIRPTARNASSTIGPGSSAANTASSNDQKPTKSVSPVSVAMSGSTKEAMRKKVPLAPVAMRSANGIRRSQRIMPGL